MLKFIIINKFLIYTHLIAAYELIAERQARH